ncbi:MAG: dCTP deaminase [Planctomycetes bacterium]|nr:dCTP deaminase [Planctomycetota bacterium]
MSILTRNVIWQELKKNRLVITPLVNGKDEIGSSSVDLHLGHEFIIFKRAKVTSVDVMNSTDLTRNVYKYQEKVRISRGQKFVLHPHQLVLGASIEYISLPNDVSGEICGRSTWGRTGLIIATATKVDTCFKGCVTLELVNEGEVPLSLYPGLCVAQIVLKRTEGLGSYKGRYPYPTGPEFPKLDQELESLPKFFKSV